MRKLLFLTLLFLLPTIAFGSGVWSGRVAAGANDATYEWGYYSTTADPQAVGCNEHLLTRNGFYFANVTIPKGSPVDSARFVSQSASNDTYTVITYFYYQDDDADAAFSDSANFKGRSLSTSAQQITITSTWATDTWRSFNIGSFLANKFARSGWSSGSGLCLYWCGGDSNNSFNYDKRRRLHSYESGFPESLIVYYGDAGPTAPTLSTPANASYTFDTTPDLDWSDVASADSYQVEIDNTSNSFPSAEVSTKIGATSAWTVTSALSYELQYWHVRAHTAAGGWGSYSTAWSFTVVQLPSALSSLTVDSLQNDRSGEWDSIRVNAQTATESGNSYLVWVWDTAYRDSSYTTHRDSVVYQSGHSFTLGVYYQGTEDYTLRVCAWVYKIAGGTPYYGGRKQGSISFYSGMNVDTVSSFSLDSLYNDKRSEIDSVSLNITTGSASGYDELIWAWGTGGSYPDSSTAHRDSVTYQASHTFNKYILSDSVETYTLRVSLWTRAGSSWSQRLQRNIVFHAAAGGGGCDFTELNDKVDYLTTALENLAQDVSNLSSSVAGLDIGHTLQDSINSLHTQIAAIKSQQDAGLVISPTLKNGETVIHTGNAYDPTPLETNSAAIKSTTDKFVFDAGNNVGANIKSADTVTVALNVSNPVKVNGGSVQACTTVVNPVVSTSVSDIAAIKNKTDLFTFSGNYVRSDQRQINGSNSQDSSGYPKVAHVEGGVTRSVGSVAGSVGSISGITFPSYFGSLRITSTGYVAPTFTDFIGQMDVAHFTGAYWHNLANRADSGNAGGAGGTTDWTANEKSQIRKTLGVTGDWLDPSGGEIQAIKSQTDQFQFDATGNVGANLKYPDTIGVVINPVKVNGGSVLACSSVVNNVNIYSNSDMAGIRARTDLIPSGGFPTNFQYMKISSGGYISPNFNEYIGQLGLSAFDNTYWHKQAQASDSGSTSVYGTLGPDVSAIKLQTDKIHYKGDSVIVAGVSAGGSGDCAIPDSLRNAVTMIRSIKANTDAWANLQFDTLTGKTIVIAALIDATGDSTFPAYLTFRPLKSDSTSFSISDHLVYGSGNQARAMVITAKTIKGNTGATFRFPLIPGALTNFPTMLYEVTGYFNFNGHEYDQIRVVVSVPEQAEAFNPFGE
jgi:hypothetical protein